MTSLLCQFLNPNVCGHGVLLAGLEGDGVGADVGGFDADEVGPFVAEVGHSVGEFFPGIPDDGVVRVLLADEDAAVERWVGELELGLGVEVGVVDALGEGVVAVLEFFDVALGVVEVGDIVKADEADVADISDAVVGVQGFLKGERRGAGVGGGELHLQVRADGDALHGAEFVGPPFAGRFVAARWIE